MNKLSADYLMDIARNHSDGDNEKYNMLVDALSEICNFYDAQIDAQAKTMEELALTKLEDCKVDMDKVKKFLADYKIDIDRDMMNIFEAKLAGFLSAGGTIKE